MVTSRSAGIERSKWSLNDRPHSSAETARSRVQTRKGQDHLKRNRRLQDGRTRWEMWVSEKTNVHHEATASITWGMPTKIQSLGNGQLTLRTPAGQRFSLLRRVLSGHRGQPTSCSIGEFFHKPRSPTPDAGKFTGKWDVEHKPTSGVIIKKQQIYITTSYRAVRR